MAEPLSALVALLAVVSPYAAVGAAGAWRNHRSRRWSAKLASSLGVEFGPSGASRTHRGIKMWIGVPSDRRLVVHARFSLPFDLGLEVTRSWGIHLASESRGFAGSTNPWHGAHPTKHSMTIQGVRFAATDERRTPLIATRDVVAAIRSAMGLGELRANDASVALTFGTGTSTERVTAALDALANVVDAFEAARLVVPVAPELRDYHGYFLDLAKDYGFSGVSCPLAMWGEIEGRACSAVVTRAPYGAQLRVRAQFGSSLGGVLEIHPETSMVESGLPALEDIRIGEPAFDAVFFVRSNEPGRARVALRGLTEKILAIAQHAPVVIDDEGVELRTQSLPPTSHVSALIDVARSLAADVETRFGIAAPVAAHDPYRGATRHRR